MKIVFILITLLISYPVFSACPVDDTGSACIAEFQNLLQNTTTTTQPPFNPAPKDMFTDTVESVQSTKEIGPNKELKNLPFTGNDYGYNSSCQFGVCLDQSMVKTFPYLQN